MEFVPKKLEPYLPLVRIIAPEAALDTILTILKYPFLLDHDSRVSSEQKRNRSENKTHCYTQYVPFGKRFRVHEV